MITDTFLPIPNKLLHIVCRYTHKPTENYVYALLTEWPDNGILKLDMPIPTDYTTVTMLGRSGNLPWQGKIEFPGMMIDIHSIKSPPCQWAWVFKLAKVQ